MNRKERRSQAGPRTAPKLPPDEAEKLLRQALAYHQAGRPQDAGPLYDKVLSAYPNQPDALHFSGILLAQIGRPADGAKRLARAVKIAPDHGEIRANYGQVLVTLGRAEAAEDALRRAIELQPSLHDAHNNLGNLLKAQGDRNGAESAYRTAIEHQPNFAGAWNNLGNLLSDNGRDQDALDALRKAADLAPEFAGTHSNMGAILMKQGDIAAAEACLRRALKLAPTLREAHEHLGYLCLEDGRYREAIACFETALTHGSDDPGVHLNLANALRCTGQFAEAEKQTRMVLSNDKDSADALRVLGVVLREQNRLAEAQATLEHALDLEPENPTGLNDLGWVLEGQGRLSEATDLYENALAQRPDYAVARNNLGVSFLKQGLIEKAEQEFLHVLDQDAENTTAASNLLMMYNYRAFEPARVFAQHQTFAAPAIDIEPFEGDERDRARDRPLRIGFVSADFRRHSVAFFLAPLLENIDRNLFEITCYANVARSDETTRRLRELADNWVNIVGMTDAALTRRIRDDAIDILIDLSGHTRGNRMAAFAARCAPVQATWLGYPNTTAVEAMDFRLTDPIADPVGADDAFYTETRIRMPDGFLCYQAPADAGAVASPPCLQNGFVTFGSFNNWTKVSSDTVVAWSEVLNAIPDSRLYLKANALADPGTRIRCLHDFNALGINSDRIEVAGWFADPADHLAAYARCDVALDTWPYSGTTTTCEALWMGVPVITRTGDRHASRVSASLLHRIGLDELVAPDISGFVEIAKTLAADTARLKDLRQTLRNRVQSSPLSDAAAFARQFETALREMWEQSA